jgi:hypothetical protein
VVVVRGGPAHEGRQSEYDAKQERTGHRAFRPKEDRSGRRRSDRPQFA